MASDSLDHIFKILLIGDAGVGKSSILLQFTDNCFDGNLQSTIGMQVTSHSYQMRLNHRLHPKLIPILNCQSTGVDFKVKVLEAIGADGRSKKVKITIWDTGMDFAQQMFTHLN